ncbi:Ankyrin repeat domain containing protein [Pandoravirus salinus]|uniref:Ankyrin repeat domain containing protein n=1 Tax=Pandoravirus salinus TaxID=1349410 RepID=S4W4K0_9VIRU|nr:ankyrin repeat domain [Pandoravirus salinus]AGO85265.2 Ankyrin repeat domain containing protein [Pandoravirus salinus]
MDPTDTLPDELVALIFSFLSCIAIRISAGRVCGRWRRIATDPKAIGRPLCVPSGSAGDLSVLAAGAGHHGCIDDAVEIDRHAVGPANACILASAVRSGNARCIEYVRRRTDQSTAAASYESVCSGRVDLVEMFDWQGHAFHPVSVAASRGHTHLIDYFCQRGLHVRFHLLGGAMAAGRVDVLRWAVANGCVPDPEAHRMAARSGSVECLRFLDDCGCSRHRGSTSAAAFGGHLDVIRYMDRNGYDRHTDDLCSALQGGRVEVVDYMHRRGWPWCDRACERAASSGNVEMLACVRALGRPWTPETCAAAAGNGHFDMLVYARSNGCPWDGRTCAAAAASGRLDILTYVHAHGCPWDKRTTRAAVEFGRLACLVFACEHGCPIDADALAEHAKRDIDHACFCYAYKRIYPDGERDLSRAYLGPVVDDMISGEDISVNRWSFTRPPLPYLARHHCRI